MPSFSEQFRFVEFCQTVTSRGNLIPIGKLRENVNEAQKRDPRLALFRSVQLYEKEAFDHVNKVGSLKGYKGTVWSDILPIDIDNDGDLPASVKVAKAVLKALFFECEVMDNEVRVAFSGKKGFHINIPQEMLGFEPSPVLHKQMQGWMENFAKLVELPEEIKHLAIFDPAMYSNGRLYRISDTPHQDTGLYKVYIDPRAILEEDLDYIMSVAKREIKSEFKYVKAKGENPALKAFWPTAQSEALKKQRVSLPVQSQAYETVAGAPPSAAGGEAFRSDQRVCMQRMMHLKLKEGEGRNEVAIRLASHWANLGFPADIVTGIMRQWNSNQTMSMPASEIDHVIQQGLENQYYYGCDDKVLVKYCTPDCFKYGGAIEKQRMEERGEKLFKKIEDVSQEYFHNISNKRFSTFGFTEMDALARGIAPGEVCGLMARTGTGKTVLSMQMALNITKSTGKKVLFLQQELGDTLILERAAGLAARVDQATLENFVLKGMESGDLSAYNGVIDQLKKEMGSIYFCTRSNLSTQLKRDFISEFLAEHGKDNVAAVFEDYLGLGKGLGKSTYERMSELAKGLKNEIAKPLDIPYFILLQVSRGEKEDSSTPLSIHDARDTGVIEESLDTLWGASRPGYGKLTGDDHFFIQLLKSRRGNEGRDFKLKWEKRYGRVFTMPEAEPMSYRPYTETEKD